MTFKKTHLLAGLTIYSDNFFTRDKKPIILSKKKWTKNNLISNQKIFPISLFFGRPGQRLPPGFIHRRFIFYQFYLYFIYLFVLISWSIYQNTERKTTHCHWAVTGFLSATIYFFAQLSWVSQFFCWFWRSKNISKKFQSNNLKKNLFEKIFRFAQIFKSFLLKFAKILCLWLMIRK